MDSRELTCALLAFPLQLVGIVAPVGQKVLGGQSWHGAPAATEKKPAAHTQSDADFAGTPGIADAYIWHTDTAPPCHMHMLNICLKTCRERLAGVYLTVFRRRARATRGPVDRDGRVEADDIHGPIAVPALALRYLG